MLYICSIVKYLAKEERNFTHYYNIYYLLYCLHTRTWLYL